MKQPGLATIEIDGRPVPLAGVPQCFVCGSPMRERVERALAEGTRPTAIVRSLPEGARLSVRNIIEHRRRGHLPPDHEAVREVTEIAGRALRNAHALGVTTKATNLLLAEEVVQRVFEAMMSGNLEPTIRDGIQFAKLLQDEEVRVREFDRREARTAVKAILRHVKRLDVTLYRRLLVLVDSDPNTIGLRQIGPMRLP